MKTVSLGVENLCVPCHAHCRYCLLSSCGKAGGVDYERGKKLVTRLYDEVRVKRPDLHFFHYIGYCMDSEHLADYIRFSQHIKSPSADFLQLNGLELRGETDTDRFVSELVGTGIKLIDLTFYGLREYHDRFAGRAGDYDFLLCILRASQKHGLAVRTSIPVTKETIGTMEELLALLNSLCCSETALFLPHGKGRGRSLDSLRLTAEDLTGLSDSVVQRLSACRTESEWISDGTWEVPTKRTLTLALTPEEIDQLESMSLEDILSYLEDLDDTYYAAIPSCDELAALYGNPSGTRLYRRFRDLYLEWQQRYLAEHGIDIWDMNDETHHFSVRA